MLQREEAAQLSRRPEPRERMHPEEPPGPVGAVSISCVMGSRHPSRGGQARARLGDRSASLVLAWDCPEGCGLLYSSSTAFVPSVAAPALGRWKQVPLAAPRAEQGSVV